MLYADRRFKVLVVLQGTDTSGKDGTIRGVFAQDERARRSHRGLEGADRGGARARLPVAHPPEGARRRRDRDLQPQPLRGRAGAGRQGLDHGARRRSSASPRSTTSSGCSSRPAPSSSSSCSTSRRTSSASACRTASTTRPSTGSSRSATSRSARAGTPTRRPTARRSRATGTPWAPWTIVPADSKTHRNLMIAHRREAGARSAEAALPARRPGAREHQSHLRTPR